MAAINGSDLDVATQCFTRDACLITPDATIIRGRGEIRSILAQLIAGETRIEVEASSILVADGVSLGSERWTIHSVGIEGGSYAQSVRPVFVTRMVDGIWKLTIAAPWGWVRF